MSQKKIIDTLGALQEGIIEELRLEDGDLNFKIECRHLADLIDSNYSYFYGVIKSVKDLYFQPWDDEEISILSVKEIQLLKPDILNAEETDDGYVKIYSNCLNVYTGGNIFVKADDIKLFDEDLREMSIEDLIELSDKFWFSSNKAEG